MFVNLLGLAMILSIDSLGVGITYGIRKMKISLLPKLILFFISFFMLLFSISLGNLLLVFLPISLSKFIASFLLFMIGVFVIVQSITKPSSSFSSPTKKNTTPRTIQFFIRSFGITVKIIKDPIYSDLDGSCSIDIKEAIFLGLALSSDSIGTGIGFSMLGATSFLFPVLAATFQLAFLSIGNCIGKRISSITKLPSSFWNILSGSILIIVSLLKWFC